MKVVASALLGALLLCAPIAARADAQDDAPKNLKKLGAIEIQSIAVTKNEARGTFGVIDSRMRETGTAAVFFGLIGATVNSGINASEDEEKAKPYLATADGLQLASILRENLIATLSGKGIPIVEYPVATSHVLDVKILEWGLVRTRFDDPRLEAYMIVRVMMKDGRKLIWDTRVKEAGKADNILSEYSTEQFSAEMQMLAATTGKRIAYEIIYR